MSHRSMDPQSPFHNKNLVKLRNKDNVKCLQYIYIFILLLDLETKSGIHRIQQNMILFVNFFK